MFLTDLFNSEKNRKQLMIEPLLQKKIISTIIYYGVILSAIYLIGLYFITSQFIQIINDTAALDDSLKALLYQKLNYIILILFLIIVIVTLITSYLSLLFSNRIAGPIFSINRILEKNKKENTFEFIKIRDSDFFHRLAVNINDLIQRSQQKENDKNKS